jgi:excisionase family DNA binding protein
MGERRIDSRVIKLHRSYSVDEAAEALGVHKNTVANWLRQGLQPIDKIRPILIHGEELRRFLKERRHQRKSPCLRDQLWCLRCKAPQRPDGGLVDYLSMSTSGGNLRGLCPECGCLMHRRVSIKQLPAVAAQFDIAFPQAQSRLNDCSFPSLNCVSGE